MSNIQINIWDLIKILTLKQVDYVICGGVACFLHGVDRATYDLDISIAVNSENITKVIEVIKELDLKPRIPEPVENLLNPEKRDEWVHKKGALVYTLIVPDSIIQLDIFLSYPKTFDELIKNADILEVKGIKIPVSSINDLIFAKTKVNPIREKDQSDIEALKNILKSLDE